MRVHRAGTKEPSTNSGTDPSCDVLCASSKLDCKSECIPGNLHFFRMQQICGPLWCHTDANASGAVRRPGRFFDELRKPVDCEALLTSPDVDVGQETPHPPQFSSIPPHLQRAYTHGNRLYFDQYYFDQRLYGVVKTDVWTPTYIQGLVNQAKANKLFGMYGSGETNCLADGVRSANVEGKHVLVIGTKLPWVEAVCLANGARRVTTLEYATINSTHPRIDTMTPAHMRELAIRKQLPTFDVIVSFSSLEHSGLGRYGDALNPWGDIITLAKAWCITKPLGALVLAVPTAASLGGREGGGGGGGNERIRWNADRIYGPVMYPNLAVNWEQKSVHCGAQRVFTFQKAEPLR